ncbi:hypothetical protein CapIbe_024154, partial [Capra ibex]
VSGGGLALRQRRSVASRSGRPASPRVHPYVGPPSGQRKGFSTRSFETQRDHSAAVELFLMLMGSSDCSCSVKIA